ncbi:MAG: hypothetical protein R3F11_07065 [Verrucomicrobiales bacterium]
MIRLLALFVLLNAATARAADVLHLTNGHAVPCQILAFGTDFIKIRMARQIQGSTAFTTRDVPNAQIAFIEFDPLPGEVELLRNPDASDASALEKLWLEKLPHLGRPANNAGEIGIAAAAALLQSEIPGDRRRAKQIYAKVEAEDWDAARRAAAKRGRLQAMLALGETDEAMAEAKVLAEESEDPQMLIEARFVLAQAARARLRKLEEDNPRWEDDDLVRPGRNALFNETIDRFLYAYLFHGSEETAAARGLWAAAETYAAAGMADDARDCAEDIAKLYPMTPYAERANQFLQSGTLSADDPAPPPNP